MVRANVSKVKIGPIELDGLMDENGLFYVGLPQLVEIEVVPPNRSIKQLESLIGNSFPSHRITKLKTPLNSKEINAVPVEIFNSLIVELAFQGNASAEKLVRALVGLSLHQLFCDSFGQKFEKDDRQRWLETRFNTKHDFRPLTDQLQRYGFKEPWEYAKYISEVQKTLGILNGTRDFLDFATLNKLERCQTKLTAYMECGIDPYEALKKYTAN